jgi:putative transposase
VIPRSHDQRGALQSGMVFQVLNRGVARMQLFDKAADYQPFAQVLRKTLDESPMQICAYAVMPNHWRVVLCPASASTKAGSPV